MKKVLTVLCTVASIGGAALFCVCFVARRLKPKKGTGSHAGRIARSTTESADNRGDRP